MAADVLVAVLMAVHLVLTDMYLCRMAEHLDVNNVLAVVLLVVHLHQLQE